MGVNKSYLVVSEMNLQLKEKKEEKNKENSWNTAKPREMTLHYGFPHPQLPLI